VKYIVEKTLKPVIDEKIRIAREANTNYSDAILSIKVLDPAMDSGHFLVEVVDFLAHHLGDAINSDIENGTLNEGEYSADWLRREIVNHCIYGVDLNPMAVELAKVALWLKTISKDKPLSFLDHRLKCGNSLIGARLSDIKNYPDVKKPEVKDTTIAPFISNIFLNNLIGKIKELEKIGDNKLDDVKNKERIFQEFKELDAYKKVKAIADVYTSIYFGNEVAPTTGRASDQIYYDLIHSLTYPSNWEPMTKKSWFKNAQEIAEDKRIFHWELEFPEIFFIDGTVKPNPGFDAVVGNPPYVGNKSMREDDKKYFKIVFSTTAFEQYDILVIFIDQSYKLLRTNGEFSYIVKNAFLASDYGLKLRELILKKTKLKEIFDVSQIDVFKDAAVYPIIIEFEKKEELTADVRFAFASDEKSFLENKSEAFIPQKRLLEFNEFIIPTPFSSIAIPLTLKLNESGALLTKGLWRCGLARPDLKEFFISEKEFNEIPPPKSKNDYILIMQTGCVDRYSTKYDSDPDDYQYLPKNKLSKGEIESFSKEKLLVAGLSKRLECSLDKIGYGLGRVYYISKNQYPCDEYFLMSIMNSKLLNYYYLIFYWSCHLSGGYLRINSPYIEQIPIRRISYTTPIDERKALVDKGIELYNKGLPK